MTALIDPGAGVSLATILVVDDEADNREMMATVLRHEGYRTLLAENGLVAIDVASAELPQLVLLDVSMPGLDGFAVANLLKADPKTAAIPIIMVTAHDGRGSRMIGLHAGVADYLTKPVDTPELLLKIRNLLRLRANAGLAVAREA